MRNHQLLENPNSTARRGGPRHRRSTEPLKFESPRRPEVQQEIQWGIRDSKGRVRGRQGTP